MAGEGADRPRPVGLGGAFGGSSLLYDVRRERRDATLSTPRNYFLFTPLLPSAVTGTVEVRNILEPARRRLRGVRVVEGFAEAVDFEQRRVACTGAVSGERFSVPFDTLV